MKAPVINPLSPVDPESSQLGEDVDHAEGLEVVDEDVWEPKLIHEFKIDRNHFPG